MKNILITLSIMIMLSGLGNAWACVDETLSDKENFDSCSIAANKGDAKAQGFLGAMYSDGQGVTQDYKEAVKWYQKAAEQGEAVSKFHLGLRYYGGQGVTQDYKQAAKWYQESAEQGYALAQYNLGLLYGIGEGVTQDFILAHMWLNIAGASGNNKAIKLRDIIMKEMTASQIEEAQSLASKWVANHSKPNKH